VSLVRFGGRNHPQQVRRNGARPEVDERATPPELFDPLNERFGFTVDACALPRNAKLVRFWTPDDDGLVQDWSGERVWCNPPYSSIEPWVEKARGSGAELVVLLLPANRTEQGWWHRLVEADRDRGGFQCEFLSGRQRFIAFDADTIKPNERPPFGVCLLIWEGLAPSPVGPLDREAGDG
jgi:phage N-6-adenine-methyltransferase